MVLRCLTCIPRLQIQQKHKKLPYIPDNIIFEILSRLPAKSVVKFRRVCKKWLALTSSPYFTEIHCRRAAPVLLLQPNLGYRLPSNLKELDPCVIDPEVAAAASTAAKDKRRRKHSNMLIKRLVNVPSAPGLVASCDGLLLLEFNDGKYMVCNLVTGERVIVERPPIQYPYNLIRSCIFCIFFHPPTGDYRLLFWRRIDPDGESFQFSVYSFKDSSWRKLPSSFGHLPSRLVNPVVLNNTLHWMGSCTYCATMKRRRQWTAPCGKTPIITFDMVSEKFRAMPYPPEVDCCAGKKLHETMYLMEQKGQLFLCSINVGFIDLWVLEDYDNWSWVRKHRSHLDWDLNSYPFRFREFDPTYFNSTVKRPDMENGKSLVKWLLKGLTQYQLDDEIVRKLEEEAKEPLALTNIGSCDVISYKPTFVSLRSRDAISERQ